jgi:hypothetical protein
MVEENERLKRLNEVFDDVIENAEGLTRDLISSLNEYKYSAAFWFLLSFLFLVGTVQQSGYPQPDLYNFVASTLVIFTPGIYGVSRLWRYYKLKNKYHMLYEVLDEFKSK